MLTLYESQETTVRADTEEESSAWRQLLRAAVLDRRGVLVGYTHTHTANK